MSYIEKTLFCNRANYGNYRNTGDIKYIVIHYTGNDGDTDEANAQYFHNNILNPVASAHDFVDDDSITHSVPHDYIAYHCGTSGTYYHKYCRNSNSIGVEMCDTVYDGIYNLSPKTRANTISYVATLMKKYNIPIENVIRHYDVTHKLCPYYFATNEELWLKFKKDLEEEIMTGEDIYIKLSEYLNTLPESDWSQNEGGFKKATDKNIVDGTKPRGLLTREQLTAILKRLGLV